MKELGPATEDDMVLAFLRAEVDSPRYRDYFAQGLSTAGRDRQSVIDHPNLRSAQDNHLRKELLQNVRGYGANSALFTRFPTNVNWRRLALDSDELGVLKYANYPSWVVLSGGSSRLVVDGARNVAVQIVLQGPDATIAQIEREIADGKRNITAVANEIKNGKRYPPLIAVEGEAGFLILVEGHTRATAYALAQINEAIEILVGSSPQIKNWAFY